MKIFIDKIEEALDNHAPYKQFTKKEISILNKPWITYDILKAISTKNKIHKQYLKCSNKNKKTIYLINSNNTEI